MNVEGNLETNGKFTENIPALPFKGSGDVEKFGRMRPPIF